jgi:hypothetical protein
MRQISSVFLLCTVIFASTNIFASTCPIGNPDWYNGSCIDGLVAGSYPYFETDVILEADIKNQKKIKFTAYEDPTRTDSDLKKSDTESLGITDTKFKFSFKEKWDKKTGEWEFSKGHISIFGFTNETGKGPVTLMSADLTGEWAWNGNLIGFNTTGIVCDPAINAWLGGGGCTTDEVVYFSLESGFPSGFPYTDGNFSRSGVAYTSVPLPAAVWLFGSGLLGLAGIARRRKAA